MARNRETKIELTAYDDLFQTDESREEAKLSKIRDIPISQIDEFPDHPFKVLMNEDMEQLVESVKRNGVMTPATVRLKEDGRYELISGHRRKKACELAGLETLKCEVKELTRDEAIIIMVESNLQRSVILPSEKAFAYKMRLEAMNRQGQRSDLTSTPMVSKSRSNEALADNVGESREQIRRFIRLTELVPEILQMVDEQRIAFRPAVEISYLTEEQQYSLLEAMEYNDAMEILVSNTFLEQYIEQPQILSLGMNVDSACEEQLYYTVKELSADSGVSMTSRYEGRQSMQDAKTIMLVLGGGISFILGFIGVFNFINVMSVGVMSRRRELATLESIGMSKRQLRSMLRFEGIGYAAVTLLVSISLGNVIGYGVFKLFQNIVTYAIFNYPILPILAVYVVVILICFATPEFAFHSISKNSLVERLRQN